MSTPRPNSDPLAPITRGEMIELLDRKLELFDRKFELFDRKFELVDGKLGELKADLLRELASKEYVLKAALGLVGVFVALLSIAVGILLKYR